GPRCRGERHRRPPAQAAGAHGIKRLHEGVRMKLSRYVIAAALSIAATAAFAQSKEVRIAHIYGKTGALEAYAKQTQAGLQLGLEYATGGKMEVLGRKIVLIEKDDQLKPDI